MKKLLILLSLTTIGYILAIATKAPDTPDSKKKTVYVAANNGKILSQTALDLISQKDFHSVRVRHDTVFFSLKDDVLKKLNENPEQNYIENSKDQPQKK